MSDWTSPPTSWGSGTTTWRSCGWCGLLHTGVCPRVKVIEYYPDGQIKRVEFHETAFGHVVGAATIRIGDSASGVLGTDGASSGTVRCQCGDPPVPAACPVHAYQWSFTQEPA